MRLIFCQDLRLTGAGSYAPVQARLCDARGTRVARGVTGSGVQVEHPLPSITSSKNGERYGASICHLMPGKSVSTAPVVLGCDAS